MMMFMMMTMMIMMMMSRVGVSVYFNDFDNERTV